MREAKAMMDATHEILQAANARAQDSLASSSQVLRDMRLRHNLDSEEGSDDDDSSVRIDAAIRCSC